MIVCTAGHVDHGKSALVEALTGRRMDRLAVERARGITIDLNFAPLPLDPGEVASVVDVPGHEDLVRTMVAGAGGVDCALLVVAADEGIKPQTREHAAILAALGVPAGVVAITKADLAPPERLNALASEIEAWLAASPVRWARPMAVSAKRGVGLDALRDVIALVARAAPGRDALDVFRMPVDRVFSVAGTGTVVTGSVWSGAVELGALIRLLPGGEEARVRTLEVHGARRHRVEAGERAAIGLGGVASSTLGRGSEVVDSSLPWAPSAALDVELELLDEPQGRITARSHVQLLIGTSAVEARIIPAKGCRLAPGDRCLARLQLDRLVVARGGDRFVLRMPAPVGTIGGGRVLDPLPPRRRADWPVGIDARDHAARLLALLFREGGEAGSPELALRGGASIAMVDQLLGADPAVRRAGGGWVLGEAVEAASAAALSALARHHAAHPERDGMAHAELLAVAHPRQVVATAAVGDLAAAGCIVVESGVVRLAGHRPRLAGGEEGAEQVLRAVIDGGLTPLGLEELHARFPGVDVPAALRSGVAAGRIRMVRPDWPFGAKALDGFVLEMRSLGPELVSVAALRGRTGLSRKYLVPLLEWADRAGVSRRVGDLRQLT